MDALDARVEDGVALTQIALNGNGKLLFNDRPSRAHVVALCDALATDDVVERLDLSYNFIDDDGAVAIARMLRRNRTLTELDLRGNDVGLAGAAALAEALAGVPWVEEEEEEEEGAEGADDAVEEDGAEEEPAAEAAAADENEDPAAAAAAAEAEPPAKPSPPPVAGCSLVTLNLAGNPLGVDGGVAIGESLRSNTTLIDLNLNDCSLDAKALIAVLTAVNESNATLRRLSLENPRIFSEQEEHAWHAARMLAVNKTLKSLRCGKWKIYSTGVEVLAGYGVCVNESLEVLDLRCNKICEVGGAFLARIIRDNEGLRRIGLDANALRDNGAIAIADAMPECASVAEFDLRSNGIEDAGLCALARGVAGMPSPPAEVLLWGNHFAEASSIAWRDVLEYHDIVTDVTFRVVDGELQAARVEPPAPSRESWGLT